jgi:hypothetical protein
VIQQSAQSIVEIAVVVHKSEGQVRTLVQDLYTKCIGNLHALIGLGEALHNSGDFIPKENELPSPLLPKNLDQEKQVIKVDQNGTIENTKEGEELLNLVILAAHDITSQGSLGKNTELMIAFTQHLQTLLKSSHLTKLIRFCTIVMRLQLCVQKLPSLWEDAKQKLGWKEFSIPFKQLQDDVKKAALNVNNIFTSTKTQQVASFSVEPGSEMHGENKLEKLMESADVLLAQSFSPDHNEALIECARQVLKSQSSSRRPKPEDKTPFDAMEVPSASRQRNPKRTAQTRRNPKPEALPAPAGTQDAHPKSGKKQPAKSKQPQEPVESRRSKRPKRVPQRANM